jgi:pectinesterase
MYRSLLSLLTASAALAQAPDAGSARLAPEPPASLEAHPALTFARYGERELQLDLWRPKDRARPLPAIVCIHGGGWWKGERAQHAALAQALAERGFVAVTISYRLSGEQPFPAQIHDAKAAVRWLRAQAATYGVDAGAIGAIGHSAGGHLTALLATSSGVPELEGDGGNASMSSAIQAAVAMGAQSDLQSPHVQQNEGSPEKLPMWVQFLGGSYRQVPERYRAASPAHYLGAGDPPLAFITGETDHASTQAEATRRLLMGLGIPTGLTIIKGAGHGIFQKPEWARQVVDTAAEFFTLHLAQGGAPPVPCEVPGLFADGAKWRLLGSGYAGCEGAQWHGETLHYAAHHDGFAFKWSETTGLVVWRKDSPEATSFRPDGRGGFYVVEQTTRQLARWNAQGERVEVLAERFEGRRLNRPNDCVVTRDGSVWFTDPDWLFALRPQDAKELSEQNVYRYNPQARTLTAVARGLDKPNGLAFSPDEKWLYVTDSGTPNLYRWPVNADGTLGKRTVFATFAEKGLDGLAFDPDGRLWCCTRDGIRVLEESGKPPLLIATPGKPTSIAFSSRGELCVTTREACFVTHLR